MLEVENMNYIVYEHVNKINGKKYIGITSQSISDRSGAYGSKYKTPLFRADIDKYGWDNFEHNIIAENLTREEAEMWEDCLINYLDLKNPEKGYNIHKGGTGGYFLGQHHTSQAKQKISQARKEQGFNEIHKKHLSESKQGVKHPRAKKVYQYTLDGELIKVWDYMNEASEALGIKKTCISSCALKKRKTAGGYIWRYE